MKIAATWHSNAPWAPSGYGVQTAEAVSRMNTDGHAIMVAANFGLQGTVMDWDGTTVYPAGADFAANDVVGPYFDDWSAQHPDHFHMQFTLYDVYVYDSPRFDDIPTASWVPIDHMPAPAAVVEFLRKPTVTPICMARFGQRMLADQGVESLYVPHMVNTKVYKPTARATVNGRLMTGREIIGIDRSRWVVGCINANTGGKGGGFARKAWAENILAFSIFAKRHDDAVLYLHTESQGAHGLRLKDYCKAVGLQPHQYKFVNQYAYRMGIPAPAMAAIYSDLDVLLSPTLGEGFGVPVAEAGACGLRQIVQDFSAQPEVMSDGWLVEGQPLWDESQGAWFQLPFVSSIVDALEQSYATGRGISQKAIDYVTEHYDSDTVYERDWKPALAVLSS